MFEVTIKDLENGEVKEQLVTEGICLLAIRGENEPDTVLIMNASIDGISTAIGNDGTMRAAARLGIAKYEGLQDVKREDEQKKIRRMIEMLESLKGE